MNPLKKFTTSSRSIEFKDILPCNISQMITKTVPTNTKTVISNEGHPVVNMMESQWKLTQQHDQNFLNKGKPL